LLGQSGETVFWSEDFNAYEAGPLAGQGGWELWSGSTLGPLVHADVEGTDGTPLAGPPEEGATGVTAVEDVVSGGFGLMTDDVIAIEFDILRVGSAASIPQFGIGSPNVAT